MSKSNLDVLEEEAIEVLKQHAEEFAPSELREWMIKQFKHDYKPENSALIDRLLIHNIIVLVHQGFPDNIYRRTGEGSLATDDETT
jgi:hypothetical protein